MSDSSRVVFVFPSVCLSPVKAGHSPRRRPGAARASRAFRLMPIHKAARQDAWASRKLFLRSE